ncbi:hypothetical protein BX268_1619 [Streptomyces sp. 2221.1]|nr:hypothetical protein BX268_1619 [Streptomyces sp. 2221.1]
MSAAVPGAGGSRRAGQAEYRAARAEHRRPEERPPSGAATRPLVRLLRSHGALLP